MYLYFDKLGKLKEIINDESLRQGSDNVNTIYCFFEGDRIVNSVDFSILRNGDSQAITFDQDVDSPVVKEIPYDENRSLYYFKYFTNYTFYKYTLTQANLSVSGVIKITIRAYDNANKIFALGLYVGNVEKSSLQITSTITNSEYEDLLKVLSTKSRWVDIERYIGVSRQELANLNKTNVIDYLGSVVGSMTSLDLTNLIYTPCEGDSKTLNVSGTLNAEQLRILNNFIAYKNIKILQVQLPNNYFNVVSTITSTGQLIGYSVDSQSPNVAHYFYINIDLKTGEVSSATSFVYSIATSQDIKIVEDKIKTINTSITDLTARVSANESLINTINTTLGETVTKLNAVDHTASTALLIAQNRTETITYNDNASLNSALPTLEKNTLKVGDNVFIIQTDVPDWWVSAINETIGTETLPTIVGGVFNKSYHIGYFTISQLETQKVDLTNYQTKEDASLTTTNKTIVGAINEVKAGGTTVVANNGQATTSDLKTITIDGVNYGVDEVADNTANPIDLGDVSEKLQTYSYSFEIIGNYVYSDHERYKIIKQRFKITLGTDTAMFDVYMKKASSFGAYCTYFGTLTYDFGMPIKVDLSCFYDAEIQNEQLQMVGGLIVSVFLDSLLNKISSDYDNDGISGGVLEALTFTDCANQRKSYYIPFVNQTAIPTQDLKAIQVGDNVYGIPTTNITASASISNTTGTPSVIVTTSGTSNAKDFKFAFSNLKGDTGPQGAKGDTGTTVVANNGQATTQELTTLFVDSVNYSLPQGGGGGSVVTKIDYLPNNAPLQGIAIDGVNYRLVQQGGILNENCLAFGSYSSATRYYSSAFGSNSSATSDNSSAFGYNSSATSYNTSAFGYNSSATGNYSSAFGSNSSATRPYSSAFGYNSSATSDNSSAFGYKSSATSDNSSAFGSYSSATNYNTLAFGYNSSVYVPSWVSIDGVNDNVQRTFTLKDTDHLFFRNENVNSTKETQSSYTNGKTLTQVLNPLGVGIKNILSIILNKDESYEIPSTIGKHHLIVIGTKTSHNEGDTDKIGLVGVTNGAIFNEDISGNKAIEIDILRTPSDYYYKVTSVGSNGVYKILSGTDTFRLVYTVTTTMTTCSINIIDEFSQGETL